MNSFYKSAQWRVLRAKVIETYGEQCMSCGITPSDSGKVPHVDHIYPRSRFPHLELEFGNLQVLCEQCNTRVKRTYIVDYRTLDVRKKFAHVFENENIKPKVKNRSNLEREEKRRLAQSSNTSVQMSKREASRLRKLQVKFTKELNAARSRGHLEVTTVISKYRDSLTEHDWKNITSKCNINHLL